MGSGITQKGPNIGDLLNKVARSCLLHPMGRKISQGPFTDIEDEESSDFASADNDYTKKESFEIQPMESSEYDKLLQRMHAVESLISEIFETAYSLKAAYIRLQIAHSPYDPEKLHEADKAVVAEIRKLSDLKQSYRKINNSSFTNTDPWLLLHRKIHDMEDQKKISKTYETVVKELKAEVKHKDTEIQFLKHNLKEATKNKEKLERRLKKHSNKDHGGAVVVQRGVSFESPTPELFQSVVEQVKESSKSFTKLLMSLMKNAEWDMDAAAASIAPGVKFDKQTHKKFAFESYLCERMFHGFENESFYISGSLSSLLEPEKHRRDCFSQFRDMLHMEPAELLNILPDCAFGKFCNKKYLRIVHPKMEEAFFGNFEHRGHVVNEKHPTSDFYQTFIRVAKDVWLLHKLAFSFNPVPSHFQVKKNTVFQSTYMESLVPLQELEEGGVQLVAFAIAPGFKFAQDFTIKSRVYVVRKLGKNLADQ